MRRFLLLTVTLALVLAASLAPKPADALPSNCGCYCVSNPTVQCKLGTTWISCTLYAAHYC
jgi:hypothetical protein